MLEKIFFASDISEVQQEKKKKKKKGLWTSTIYLGPITSMIKYKMKIDFQQCNEFLYFLVKKKKNDESSAQKIEKKYRK